MGVYFRICVSKDVREWAAKILASCENVEKRGAVSATVGSVTFRGRLCFSASLQKKKCDCIYRQQIARRVNDENNKAHYGRLSTCLTCFFLIFIYGLVGMCTRENGDGAQHGQSESVGVMSPGLKSKAK